MLFWLLGCSDITKCSYCADIDTLIDVVMVTTLGINFLTRVVFIFDTLRFNLNTTRMICENWYVWCNIVFVCFDVNCELRYVEVFIEVNLK